MLKFFCDGKEITIEEPTKEKIAEMHKKNLEFTLPNKRNWKGIAFSYKKKYAGPFLKSISFTTPGYAGCIKVEWQPTQGGWDTHLLDVLFGEGNGKEVFSLITE